MHAFDLESFEFQNLPTPLRARWDNRGRHDGKPLTYSIFHDNREIPFKFLRQQDNPPSSTSSAPSTRPTLVLLHGMGITIASFLPIAPYLFKTHDLLLVDYNSYSAAHRWPHGGVSLRLIAAGVWKIIDTLKLPRVDLLGSSLGGGLALLMALTHPARVGALALLNPAVYPQTLPRMYRVARIPILGELLMAISPAEKLISGVAYVGYSEPEKMPEAIRLAYTRNMASFANRRQLMDIIRRLPGNTRELGDISNRLHRMTAPTLILWGKQERLLLPDTGERLARDLPHAQLVEFKDLAHLPHEESPERVGPILHDFFAAQNNS